MNEAKLFRNLILQRAPNPNRHSRDLYYVAKSYDMDVIDFLHHENPTIWAGVNPANLGIKGQHQTTTPPSRLIDEAHFWLNGYVNKQNCRFWSEANPQVYVETPLHPEKLTVWCALWAGGIIGPYFFKNDEGHNVTVNGDRYRAMITNFFIPELNNQDVQELWFQQDGATCHTARDTIDLLKGTFGDRLISRFGPVNWPPRSCDLTPLDYFLWGYVKSLVYADKPQTLDHLEDNIRRVIADIRPQMLEKIIENWTSRLDYIRASRGSPMPEIIFKM
ncbi:transposable element Tc3 transposase [Trichonephila clavipes]|nr:transposable element Tc3 transposase [Trichonephila clavipes]